MRNKDFMTNAAHTVTLQLITALIATSVFATLTAPAQAVTRDNQPAHTPSQLPATAMSMQQHGPDRSSIAASLELTYTTFIPVVYTLPPAPPSCPQTSSNTYDAVGFNGGPYKGNRLTDENADYRLSILGYAPVNSFLGFVGYPNDGGDPDAPRFHAMFIPPRVPAFVQVSQVYNWNWNESASPPYGSRGALNPDWGGNTVLDLRTIPGETINIPDRTAAINNAAALTALALYAGKNELTVAYFLYDNVYTPSFTGYVVHMLNFCVDPNLLATYRAQLDSSGRRSTMKLPAIKSHQPVGTALGDTITVAIRDGARYMDPRDERDWWQGHP